MENREIKFRVFDKGENKMEFVGAIDWTDNEKIITCNTISTKHYSYQEGEEEDDFVIMQYTGLKDKNKVEIYEGDIVETNFVGGLLKVGVVEMYNGEYVIRQKSLVQSIPRLINNKWTLEVIGNIHESKHLLDNTDTKV